MITGRQIYQDTSEPAFKALKEGRAMHILNHYESKYQMILSPSAKDLVLRMLNANPASRPTLEDILVHRFITRLGAVSN